LTFLERIFGRTDRRVALEPLYRALVAAGRDPGWYRAGGVPDSLDGRFDMIAAVTALVLLRLEAEGEAGREPGVLLAELFVADMDSSLRQVGIGDYVVGKHIGRMMGALGGRLAAFRDARGGDGAFVEAVRRNIFHESPPSAETLDWTSARLRRLRDALDQVSLEALLAGKLPAL
jgi:cytochrome b pre-mRNA-processing protein 3